MTTVTVTNDVTHACPICAGSEFETLGPRQEYAQNTQSVFLFNFEDVMCKTCSFVFSKNRPQAQFLDSYYGGYFPSLSLVSEGEIEERLKALRPYARLNGKILEVGGGFSAFSSALRTLGATVDELDPSRKNGDYEKKYDLICSYYVGEHVTKLRDWMLSQVSKLSDDGRLFFEVPNFTSFPLESMNNEHVNHFKLSDVHRLFASVGLEVIAVSPTGSRYFGMWAVGKKTGRPLKNFLANIGEIESSRNAYRAFLTASAESQAIQSAALRTITSWIAAGATVGVWPCNVITSRLLMGLSGDERQHVIPFDISDEKQGVMWAGTSAPIRRPDVTYTQQCSNFVLCSPVHNVAITRSLLEFGFTSDKLIECAV